MKAAKGGRWVECEVRAAKGVGGGCTGGMRAAKGAGGRGGRRGGARVE